MPDIFLSYSRADRAMANLFVDGLRRAGYDLWWDEAVRPGEDFDQAIEAALNQARAVVVLWSRSSVDSRWVRSEAAVGQRNGVLVPVMIDDCNRPLMFELAQTIDLAAWDGGADNPAWVRFLSSLEAQVGAARGQVTAATGPTDGRRPVAIVSSALAWPAEREDTIDPEDWNAAKRSFEKCVDEVAARFGQPRVWHETSQSLLILGLDETREDDAINAVRAGVALIGAGASLPQVDGTAPQVRIGISHGFVLAPGPRQAPIGAAIEAATALRTAASAGEVLLSPIAARLVDGYFNLAEHGERGFSVQSSAAVRSRFERSQARGLAPFIGRAEPLKVLHSAMDQAGLGKGQVVGLMAEAGMGKSRLSFEFTEICQKQGLRAYAARAKLEGRDSPLSTVHELIADFLGIDRTDQQAARAAARARLLALDPDLAGQLPAILDLLGLATADQAVSQLDPDARLRQLAALLRHLIVRAGSAGPSLFVIEDLHWLDHASAVFLEMIAADWGAVPGVLAVNYRPEFRADWMAVSHFQQVSLDPLSASEVADLVTGLVGSEGQDARLVGPLQNLTGGNPFFVEEIVRTLTETGALEGEAGEYRLADKIGELDIPPAISAVISARVARLAPTDSELLKLAAIAGDEFSQTLLSQAAAMAPGRVGNALARLRQHEFLVEKSYFPDPVYTFRHPLTQEVVLGGLGRADLQQGHGAIADALEQLHQDRLDDYAASLARHREAAGDARAAITWHNRAAERAARTDFFGSAYHYERVRVLARGLRSDPDAATLAIGACIHLLNMNVRVGIDLAGADAILADGLALAHAPDQAPLRTLLSLCHGRALAASGDAEAFYRAVVANRPAAEQSGDPGLVIVAQMLACDALTHTGRNQECLAEAEAGLAALPPSIAPENWIRGYNPQTFFRFMRGIALSWLGRLDEAVAELHAADAAAVADGTPEVIGWCQYGLAVSYHYLGNAELAAAAAARADAIAAQLGSPLLVAYGHLSAIWAQLATGQASTAALARAEQVRTLLRRVERHWEGLGAVAQARLLLLNGEADRALAVAEEAIELCDRSGIRQFSIEAHGVVIKACLAKGGPARARAQTALATARELVSSRGNLMLEPAVREWEALLAG